MGFLNRKGLIGLAKFGVVAVIFALTITAAAVVMKPAEAIGGSELSVQSNYNALNAPNSSVQINFTVINNNMTGNITNISVMLPPGFAFVSDSNVTNITTHRVVFWNTSAGTSVKQFLNWSGDLGAGKSDGGTLLNASSAAGVGYAKTFSFNVKVPDWAGNYNLTTYITDNTTNVSTMINTIAISYQTSPGKTDWSYCGPKQSAGDQVVGCVGPGISNPGGFFFWTAEGGDYNQNVTLKLNFTSALSNSDKNNSNLTVWVNFTGLGWHTNPTIQNFTTADYDATTGLYTAVGLVNMSGARNFTGGKSLANSIQSVWVNITWSTSIVKGNDSMMLFPVTLMNMSTFGCPPADDAQA